MQLVIHSPFGSRINRAWGLALRKRFCLKFNFELQAAATEDAIVLSLSTSHSFELAAVARYLHSNTVRDVLIQAMLDAPMFAARWRWIAGISLALPRFRGGKKIPAPLQRMRAEDLMAAVFPDQIACAENLVGAREIPGSSARAPDDPRLPARGDGHRRPRTAVAADRVRRHRDRRARSADAVAARARDSDRAAVRLSRRRAARGAPHAGGDGTALARCRNGVRPRAGSTSRRSTACARKRGPRRQARTSCTTRCSAWAFSPRTKSRASAGWPAFVDALIAGSDAPPAWRSRHDGESRLALGRRRAAAAVAERSIRTPDCSPPIDAPAEFRAARDHARRRARRDRALAPRRAGTGDGGSARADRWQSRRPRSTRRSRRSPRRASR